jgi:ABC-type glycerol-3-phosphate transport system substrate-binding protein
MLTVALIITMLVNLSGCNDKKKEENFRDSSSSRDVHKYADLVYLSDWKEEEARNFQVQPVLATAINNYEKRYNSKVTFVFSPYSEKQGKLAAMLAAGTPPDVYQPVDGFPQFSLNGYARQIDDLINLKDPIWKDVKDAYDATEWEGKHNFVAINRGPLDVVWYNKILFKKNGLETPYDLYKRGDWNWDTFRELAIKLTQDTNDDKIIDQWGMTTGPESIIATTGNDLVNINGKAGIIENNLKNPNVINALKFFQESGPAKYNIIHPDLNGYMTDFEKGKVAMCIAAIWSDNVCWKDMMKKGECSFVPAPRYPNSYDYYVRGNADIWMIPKDSKNAKAAAAFLTELRKAQIDPQVQRALEEGDINNRGWKNQEIEMNQELQKLKYTYTFFSGVGNIGNDKWGFWGALRVNGSPVETEIEKHYNLWNNEIDIANGKVKLQHNKVTATAGTPQIDGEIDDVWKDAMEISTADEKSSPDVATAQIKLLYDTDTLYVLAKVSDNKVMTDNENTWECDSVEVYIDENNYNLNSYDSNTVQLRVGADGKMSGDGPAWDERESALNSAVKKVNGGYIVEAAYKFKEVKAKAGGSMGFNIQVNDEEVTGSRKGTSVWNPDQGSSYFNPSRFGKVNFE